MDERGLHEVRNPSQLFLGRAGSTNRPSGSCVVASIVGSRPVLVEIQALVGETSYGTPQRLAANVDRARLAMILAVLERRAGMALGSHDVYASVAGGLRIAEPAADLGIALAIASAFRGRPLPPGTVAFGELGLSGEVRAVSQRARRTHEARKLGVYDDRRAARDRPRQRRRLARRTRPQFRRCRDSRVNAERRGASIFECVPNVSEGRDQSIIAACAAAIEGAGATLAHRTSDPAHHRSVFTFFGTRDRVLAAALALGAVTTERIDLRRHSGEHPRMGALDVLPFVPFGDATLEDAARLAREAARHMWDELRVPSYFYGAAAAGAATAPDAASGDPRLLARVRRGGFEGLAARTDPPDVGVAPHASAGAVAVGAREPLVAFNVVLASEDLELARGIARTLRERDGGLRTLRALGLRQQDGRVQVSFNVTDARATPLDRIVALVAALARPRGVAVAGTELIGLVSRSTLAAVVDRAFGCEATDEPSY